MILNRPDYLQQIAIATRRSPIVAILGPRQVGKTTLARLAVQGNEAAYYDLESQVDRQRLQNPELALGALAGTVVIDEIQNIPELFSVLKVLVDRPGNRAKFLILGSASPHILKNVSETLAGRVEFIELSGFDLSETGGDAWQTLWVRGGFPRSYLAAVDADSVAWREGFIRTFLERDIPELGFALPSVAMRRFWTMLAHYHGQTWNASELSRSLGLSDKTVRSYLDILTGTYMIRQLQPWAANLAKRQVKSPKVYLRDSGILHSLLSLPDWQALLGHPKVGASWEGFAIEQIIRLLRLPEAYFWATHSGAEVDLLFFQRGKAYGMEVKFTETPGISRSMRTAVEELNLAHLWIIYPGRHSYPVAEKITVWPLQRVAELKDTIVNFE